MKKSDMSSGDVILFIGLLTVIFIVIYKFISNVGNGTPPFGCIALFFIIYAALVIQILHMKSDSDKAANQYNENQNLQINLKENYERVKAKYSIPSEAKKITYTKASGNSPLTLANSENDMYIWRNGDEICFFPDAPNDKSSLIIDEVKLFSIPIRDIEYFSMRGEISRETKISGGGGGGSSLGGAVTGALIAGEVGAVIGSRKKIDEIKSEVVIHDSRETFLNFFDENKNRCSLFFDKNGYLILNDLMPEKEYNIVSAIKSTGIIRNQITNNEKLDITSQLRELSKLKVEGIITEQEFSEKKKMLLDKIK
jgi:hypothetical protein